MVLFIALLVLGPSRLPEVARSVGSGAREFKRAVVGSADETETSAGGALMRAKPVPADELNAEEDAAERAPSGPPEAESS